MAKTYIASENTLSDIKTLTQNIYNRMGQSAGNAICPHITVTAPTGCTLTATNADTVLTATENNGVWQFDLPHLGEWTLTATKDGHSGTRTVQVNEIKEYKVGMSHGYRYGYRIKKNEGSPANRVEYLFDAVGMTPAAMNFTNGTFSYGDWGDKWFVTDNKPLMLKNDGTVDYYLDPANYNYKEDGTASDVSNTAYEGNAMAQFPLVWVYRYEDDEYEYEIISDVQYDENYKAYAHTRADGTIADYFYYSMFGGSGSATKIRSLAGQSLANTLTAEQEITGCKANGAKWYAHSWSQHELIRTLLILMGKSTNTQAIFGNGNCREATAASGMLTTGTLKDKGQFFGYNTNNQQVKVFHVEKFWGDQWDRVAGLLVNNAGKVYAKMTPEGQGYRITDMAGYIDTGIVAPLRTDSANNGTYINGGKMTEYGFVPTKATGSSSTYYADGLWGYYTTNAVAYLFVGASAAFASAIAGAFTFHVNYAPSHAGWHIGCGLSCEQPAA